MLPKQAILIKILCYNKTSAGLRLRARQPTSRWTCVTCVARHTPDLAPWRHTWGPTRAKNPTNVILATRGSLKQQTWPLMFGHILGTNRLGELKKIVKIYLTVNKPYLLKAVISLPIIKIFCHLLLQFLFLSFTTSFNRQTVHALQNTHDINTFTRL